MRLADIPDEAWLLPPAGTMAGSLAEEVFRANVLQEATSSVPIVFIGISEPVTQGFVASVARPGGNITGFTNLEWTFGAKWLEMLREIAPAVSRGRNMRIDYHWGAGDLDIALFADQPTGGKRIVTQRRPAAGDVHSCTTRQWRGDRI